MLAQLAADIRFMQFYAHNMHNLCKGPTFFQDHEFLGELYPVYEGIYDGIIERMIGLGIETDLIKIHKIAQITLEKANMSPENCFASLLQYEKHICRSIEEMLPKYSEGTKQMLGDICDQSEKRQYQLKQRTK